MPETTIYAHPARVLYQQTPEDATRWLEIVTSRRATDPGVFERRPPFFWPAEISSRRLDAYYTRMDAATSLRNFARAANEGVAFQNSHRWMELPLGQSVEGTFLEAGDEARTLAVFYTIPGLNVNGVDTAHFIDGLRAGIIHDVSVGFYGGRFLCGLCGRDMLTDWQCPHVPGLTYQVKEPDGDVRTPVLCTATVVDAELSEVSAVYDGATPGATVLKAQVELDAGRLDARQANMTPEVAAKTLRYLESVWPGELWCCGNRVASHRWFDRMLTAYKATYRTTPRLAGVHVHVDVGGGLPDISNPDDGRWLAQSQVNFRTYLDVMHRWNLPPRVVVSECCLLGKYPEGVYLKVQDAYMRWLRSEPAVESIAWFSARYAGFPDSNLLRQGGGVTVLGQAWLDWRWK